MQLRYHCRLHELSRVYQFYRLKAKVTSTPKQFSKDILQADAFLQMRTCSPIIQITLPGVSPRTYTYTHPPTHRSRTSSRRPAALCRRRYTQRQSAEHRKNAETPTKKGPFATVQMQKQPNADRECVSHSQRGKRHITQRSPHRQQARRQASPSAAWGSWGGQSSRQDPE